MNNLFTDCYTFNMTGVIFIQGGYYETRKTHSRVVFRKTVYTDFSCDCRNMYFVYVKNDSCN